MQDFFLDHYFTIQALHVISFIAWMAGMLYLPRLYVYHAETESKDVSETFKVMERRLLRFIMTPAMIATWVFGLLMLYAQPALLDAGAGNAWMHAKLTLVVLLSACHGIFSKWRKEFAKDANKRSPRFYRIWNEVPTGLMVLIVILAVTKPF